MLNSGRGYFYRIKIQYEACTLLNFFMRLAKHLRYILNHGHKVCVPLSSALGTRNYSIFNFIVEKKCAQVLNKNTQRKN